MAIYNIKGVPIIEEKQELENVYIGKNALWLGDSISVVGDVTYPQKVCTELKMGLNNRASSGGNSERMRNILQGLNEFNPPVDLSNIDYCFIMIGHNCASEGLQNDSSKLSDIPTDGTSYTEFPNTYYGNVASCIEYMWAKKSDIKIVLLTPIQSGNGGYIVTTAKARKALEEIATFYSLPLIDVYAKSGICTKEIAKYTYDNIHPNAKGIEMITDCIVDSLVLDNVKYLYI